MRMTPWRLATSAAADCARVFNVHAALAWNTLRRKGQVQAALASRDVITALSRHGHRTQPRCLHQTIADLHASEIALRRARRIGQER